MGSRIALDDIGWNRQRCPTQLPGQTVALSLGKVVPRQQMEAEERSSARCQATSPDTRVCRHAPAEQRMCHPRTPSTAPYAPTPPRPYAPTPLRPHAPTPYTSPDASHSSRAVRRSRGPAFAQVDDPRPAAGEVVVRLHAAGVNPVEAYIRTGQYARLPELPYTPGGDGAGVVESLGEGVTGVAVGDRVYVAAFLGKTGTYAERIACQRAHVHRAARRRVVWPGRGAWGPGGDGLSGAGAARTREGGRDRTGTWRQRRGRHRGRAAGARDGAARVRHGGQRGRRQRRRETPARTRCSTTPGRLRQPRSPRRQARAASTSSSRCWPTSTSIAISRCWRRRAASSSSAIAAGRD